MLYGEHEPGFIRRHAPRLGTAIPNASVLEVPGAGHASTLDEPEFFTDAVREFLEEIHPAKSETAREGAETDEPR